MNKYKLVQLSDGGKFYRVAYGELTECKCGCGPLVSSFAWFRTKDRAERFSHPLLRDPDTPSTCRKLK